MSAAKKNAKGSKTAHVLNLLTAPGAAKESAAPAGEETGAESAVPDTAAASRPLLPPILEVAQANDDNLSQQIQQALEEELQPDEPAAPEVVSPPAAERQRNDEEVSPPMEEQPTPSGGKMSQDEIEKLLAAASAPEAPPPPAPEPPAASGGKMSQDEIEKLLAAASAPEAPPPPAPEPPAASGGKMSQDEIEKLLAAASAPEAPPPPKPQPVEEDVSYVNIMEALVEEKAPQYIKKFGLCSCKHCEVDVKALTLTNLVPKYVVLSKMDRIPMLTVYEGRYNSTIFAQLTRACKTVMDHPHHNRDK